MYRLFLLLLVLLTCLVTLYLDWPWYVPAFGAAVAAGLLPVWRRSGFYFSFLAAVMMWGCYAGYLHLLSEGRLGDRLAVTFGVPTGWVLVVVTALWGGLTAGLGGLLGASLRIAIAGGKR
ncbi:hypothetical protein GGR26_001994 [Lewinella marina]|uniref:Uncharacterized protein n=1 Tax=Neolewinella marina TaxID=438751 RepID=A0A2G0CH63_9BACT|nr:hypothetical protein [Neolewinella marina]NJB86226.1 hypothetical protein [Neolewinella marina]PHK99301.1 hypothetical protein CGL56_07550 [Neolewinella marina]